MNAQSNLFKRIINHKVFQTFGIYTGSSVLNKALPFLLMPVMTKYLTPVEYGILAIYQALISFSVPFIGMSMQTNVTREFYKVPKEKIARLMSNLIVVLVGSSTIVMLITFFYVLCFKSLNGISAKWLYTVPFVTFLTMINQLNLVVIRNEQKALTYGFFEVGNTMLQLGCSVLLVVVMKCGWEGRAYATVIAALAFGVIGLIHMLKTNYLKWNYNRETIKEILHISIPFIPYSLGTMIIFFSDRFFIDHWSGKAAVGLYAVGYSFGMIVTIFKDAFAKAWAPWMFKSLVNVSEESKIKIVRFSYLYMAGMIVLALGVTFASYIAMHFMANERYHGAKQFIIWIALANAVNAMYSVMMPYNVHMGKTKPLAWIMFSAAAFNLLGNIVLVPLNGPVGAAQATLLAFCISFLFNWWHVQKIHPMPWFDKRIFDWRLNEKVGLQNI